MWFSLLSLESYMQFNNLIIFIASLIETMLSMFQSCNIMLAAENKLAKEMIASWQIKYVYNMYKFTYYVMYEYV